MRPGAPAGRRTPRAGAGGAAPAAATGEGTAARTPSARPNQSGTSRGYSAGTATGADRRVGQLVTGVVRRYPPAATGGAERHAIDCRDQVTVVEHPVRMLLDDH